MTLNDPNHPARCILEILYLPGKYTKKLEIFQFLAPKKIRKGSEASETFRLYPYDAGNSSSSPDVVIFGEIENF